VLLDKLLRLIAREDWEGDTERERCGVEPEVSESESNELARLCMLNDWVSLEFIRASLVTFHPTCKERIVYTLQEGCRPVSEAGNCWSAP